MLRNLKQKQDRIDNALITESKEIPYAINESMHTDRFIDLKTTITNNRDIDLLNTSVKTGIKYWCHDGEPNYTLVNYPPELNKTAFTLTSKSYYNNEPKTYKTVQFEDAYNNMAVTSIGYAGNLESWRYIPTADTPIRFKCFEGMTGQIIQLSKEFEIVAGFAIHMGFNTTVNIVIDITSSSFKDGRIAFKSDYPPNEVFIYALILYKEKKNVLIRSNKYYLLYFYLIGEVITMLRLTKQQNQFYFNAHIVGNRWKRLVHIIRDPVRNNIGLSFLIHITSHINNTVFNNTLLITTGHQYYGEITQLAGTNFSKFFIRIICSSYGNVYLDILDNSSWLANNKPDWEMPLDITISKLSNTIIEIIDEYVEEDDIPASYKLIETMETKGYSMIVSSITEKQSSNYKVLYEAPTPHKSTPSFTTINLNDSVDQFDQIIITAANTALGYSVDRFNFTYNVKDIVYADNPGADNQVGDYTGIFHGNNKGFTGIYFKTNKKQIYVAKNLEEPDSAIIKIVGIKF